MELRDSSVYKSTVENVEQEEKKTTRREYRSQVTIVFVCLLVGIAIGMSLGHCAVLLPRLQSANSSLYVDEETGSWITSLYAGAGPFGSLVGGIIIDQWGRRKICFVANIGLFLGGLLVCLAQKVSMLISGKTIEGFFKSMLATSLTVLTDELADPKFRGSTICAMMTFGSIGIMAITSLGTLWDWRSAAGVTTAVFFLSVFPLLLVSESPSWLVRKGRLEEAERSLKWLWGPGREMEAGGDLDFLVSRNNSRNRQSQNLQGFLKSCRGFFTSRILKPFFILHFFNTIQVFCGFTLFTFYAVDILLKLREAGGKDNSMDENFGAIIMSFVRIVGNVAAALIMIRVGRRSIALISGMGATISALTLGVVLILQSIGNVSFGSDWLTFTLTVLFVWSHSFGFLLLPVLMIGETQPAQVRGFVCGYIYTVNDLVLGSTLKFYHSLLRSLEIHGLFLLFGASCLICTIFVYFFLPETQGRTLEQIEDYFRQPNVMWVTRNRNTRCERNCEQSTTERRTALNE